MALDPDVVVHSMAFGPAGVEITYQESRRRTQRGERIETILIKSQDYDDDIGEILVAVSELIDRYCVDERDPPGSIRGGSRNG